MQLDEIIMLSVKTHDFYCGINDKSFDKQTDTGVKFLSDKQLSLLPFWSPYNEELGYEFCITLGLWILRN